MKGGLDYWDWDSRQATAEGNEQDPGWCEEEQQKRKARHGILGRQQTRSRKRAGTDRPRQTGNSRKRKKINEQDPGQPTAENQRILGEATAGRRQFLGQADSRKIEGKENTIKTNNKTNERDCGLGDWGGLEQQRKTMKQDPGCEEATAKKESKTENRILGQQTRKRTDARRNKHLEASDEADK